jgi:type IV fimbrial biogenesis protein FimT
MISITCKQMQGVTLIEMITVLIIVAIVMSIAVPTFNTTMARGRLTSYTNELLAFLSFARSEAIVRGQRVVVCKSANGASCTLNGNWDQGFIVFVDDDNNAQINNGELLLRVHEKLNSITMKGNTQVQNYIGYSSDGRSRTITGALQMGTLSLCNGDINLKLRNAIRISRMGRVRSDDNCKFCPAPVPECASCTASCP